MPSGYHHLAAEERTRIECYGQLGWSQSAIAKQLGRHRSTISRELFRNGVGLRYRGEVAQAGSTERRRLASSVPRQYPDGDLPLVRVLLEREQWNPEQISGRLRACGPSRVGVSTIYRWIADRARGGKVYKHLRRGGKKPNRRKVGQAGRGCIPGRVDISERPAIVDAKTRDGDWELDTVHGPKHEGVLVTLVERYSKRLLLAWVPRNTRAEVEKAVIRLLAPYRDRVLTITSDNGKEFAGHRKIARRLDADFFFAKPYHSWQRGLNEHTNGLIRQYLPKGRSFASLDPAEVREIERKLNNRPRKCLNFRTPQEVFTEPPEELAAPP